MKKIVLAALGTALLTGIAVDSASAAQRNSAHRTVVQTPNRANDGFRNSYNSYGSGFDRPAYDARIEGGAISAPAGR